MKKVLVLGAGGFIGKNLCLKLAEKQHVVAYDLQIDQTLDNHKNITCIAGDFVTTVDFSFLLERVDVVYHLIGTTLPRAGTGHIIPELEDNLIPTLRVLEAMKKESVKRLIFASSGGTIYGENEQKCQTGDMLHPKCSYGVLKRVVEDYLDFYNTYADLSCISARLANPYGTGQDVNRLQGVIPIFVRALLNGDPITIFGDGDVKRDYIFLDDMTTALVKLAEYSGTEKIFNIGSGIGYSLNEIIKKIELISGSKFKNIQYKPKRDFDVATNVLDTEITQKELGWSCTTSLDAGINKLLYFSQQTI